jgi:hypothetical protein
MGFDNDRIGTLMPFGAPSTPSFPDGVANGSAPSLSASQPIAES